MLHRDIGYLAVGLTLAYAISGLAVNHRAGWNPNYRISKEFVTVAPITATTTPEIVAGLATQLKLDGAPKSSFQPDAQTLQLFYKGKVVHVDLPTGKVMIERTVPRPVLYEMNQLHLNGPKQAWTYVADAFAVALIVLAITGMFVLKGRLGITGRGGWLTAAGVLIPAVAWFLYLR
ncbi:MAG: PepSY-associated TM helix domain-containing protein [Gemmatimonadaceae bacterium]